MKYSLAPAIALVCSLAGCGGQETLPADDSTPTQVCTPAAGAGRIEHLIAYGQSLSLGVLAQPALTSFSRHDSLRFIGGVRPSDSGTRKADIYAALTALVESDFQSAGETPVAGALEMINDLILAEDGLSYQDTPQRYLGSAAGTSGLSLAELSQGTTSFARLADHIRYGRLRVECSGKPYAPRAVLWVQGESDYIQGTSSASYNSQLQLLQQDIAQEAARLTGGSAVSVPLISYQIASHAAAGVSTPTIALAQLQASHESPDIHIAAPAYAFDYTDDLHLQAASSKALGAYMGITYKRLMVDRQSWQPLEPLSAVQLDRDLVRVRFNVPQPPLALDTRLVRNPGQFGFSMIGANNANLPISQITVSGPDELTLRTSLPIVGSARLRYGYNGGSQTGRLTGPRGNLRDSQGDSLVFDPSGIAWPMHNWCVFFEMPVS